MMFRLSRSLFIGAIALAWAAQAGAAPLLRAADQPAQSAVRSPTKSQAALRKASAARDADAQAHVAQAPAVASVLVVHRGQRLSDALAKFGKSFPPGQRWTVLWYCQDWEAPGRTVFKGDFMKVSKEFIGAIAGDGADIHGKWWLGNRTLVVTGSGAMQ